MHETLTFTMVFLFGQSAIRRCITPCTRSWKHPPHLLVDILQAIWPYEHSCGISLELKLLINSRWVKINFAIGELLGWGERRKTCNDSVHYMECQYWLMNIWHTSSHWMTSGCNYMCKLEAWFPSCTEYASNGCRCRDENLDCSMTPQIAWPNWKTTQFR